MCFTVQNQSAVLTSLCSGLRSPVSRWVRGSHVSCHSANWGPVKASCHGGDSHIWDATFSVALLGTPVSSCWTFLFIFYAKRNSRKFPFVVWVISFTLIIFCFIQPEKCIKVKNFNFSLVQTNLWWWSIRQEHTKKNMDFNWINLFCFLSVCPLIISTNVYPIDFTLGGCIADDPRECSVAFGAI